MKKDVKENMFIPQFEFSESSINEMVEAAKRIGEDIKDVIIEVFSFGVKIGASNMLETINDTAALFNGDSVLHVSFDENTGTIS